MTISFSCFCDLLEEVARNRHLHSTTAARAQHPDHRIYVSWFNKFDGQIKRTGSSAIALLSALFPERRVDRVYNLQEKRLSAIFGRALGLGYRRAQELNQWRQRDGVDFSTCVERVMAQCEFDVPPPDHEVTLEEVDAVLQQLAANSPFSSPLVRAGRNSRSADELLGPVLQRMQSREAKWLVRMILKSYIDIQIPERLVLTAFHFLLPHLLAIQNSFEAAVEILGQPSIQTLPARPSKEYEKALLPLVARDIIPKVGVMIQRQPYFKARSIKHCCNMTKQRHMSVERKYDGEYCQIHIDLSKGPNCIQIFSKSGKDSTRDRIGLHGAIRDCLKLDQQGRRFQQCCIVEGELLVWSLYRKCILPFHKIRKYVQHGGRRLGCAADSPLRSDEHLMIAFYDVLLLDDKMLLNEPLTVRRHHLEQAVFPIEGRGIIGERSTIDFASNEASRKLREMFAQAIVDRWEGFVLKYCDEAYFSWQTSTHGIKLKKDYIAGMGDSADLCLVGGRRDARVEIELHLGHLRWTSFHVGCIVNKDDVRRFHAKPNFKIVDELTHHSMSNAELLDLNRLGQFTEIQYVPGDAPFELELLRKNLSEPSEIFKQPFIIEIIGAGFERPSDCDFYTLRFPRKVDGKIKLHSDRDITDTISFRELQDMALESTHPTLDQSFEEEKVWVERLLMADGKSQSTRATSELSSPPSNATRSVRQTRSTSVGRSPLTRSTVFVRADPEDLVMGQPSDKVTGHATAHVHSSQPNTQLPLVAMATHGRSLKRSSEVLIELPQPRLTKKPKARAECLPESNTTEEADANSRKSADDCIIGAGRNKREGSFVSLSSFVEETPQANNGHNSEETPMNIDNSPCEHRKHSSLVSPATCVNVALPISTIRPSPNVDPAVASAKALLPTPPSSDASKAVVVTEQQPSRAVPPVSTGKIATKKSIRNVQKTNTNMHETSALNMEPKLADIVYIPRSVSQNRNKKAINELYDEIISLKITYTHVLESFLDSVDSAVKEDEATSSGRKTYHVILLDFNNLPAAKADLDLVFSHLIGRAHGRAHYQQLHNNAGSGANNSTLNSMDPCTWLKDNIMLWDYSMIRHAINMTKIISTSQPNVPTEMNMSIDLDTLASMRFDRVGSELFAGFMRMHRRTWVEKGVKRYFLVKHWDWVNMA